MRASSSFAFVILVATMLAPSAARGGVGVVADPQSRIQPQGYWVIRSQTADGFAGLPRQILLRKISDHGYGEYPIGRPATLPDGNYYIYPGCPRIGIWPEGRWRARNGDPPVRLKCP
jgi:hypothetical protein